MLARVRAPRTLARRALFAVAVGTPAGVWSALASMPGADSTTVTLSAAGAAGTYSCALMVLLESAFPRPAALSRSSGGGRSGGGWRGGGRRGGGGRDPAGSVLIQLYVGVVACMPVAAVAQASVERGGGGRGVEFCCFLSRDRMVETEACVRLPREAGSTARSHTHSLFSFSLCPRTCRRR